MMLKCFLTFVLAAFYQSKHLVEGIMNTSLPFNNYSSQEDGLNNLNFSNESSLEFSREFTGASFNTTSTCGFNRTVSSTPFNITSPGWPDSYPNSAMCQWILRTNTSGYKIQMEFSLFQTEDFYDTLKIFDDVGSFASHIFTGEPTTPFVIVSKSDVIIIRFRSDDVHAARGFHATVREVEMTSATSLPTTKSQKDFLCDAGFNILGIPGYPVNHVSERMVCTHGSVCATFNTSVIFNKTHSSYPATLLIRSCMAPAVCSTISCRSARRTSDIFSSQLYHPLFDYIDDGCVRSCCDENNTCIITSVNNTLPTQSPSTQNVNITQENQLSRTVSSINLCGFNERVTSVPLTIETPGWPRDYGSNLICEWSFTTTTPGYKIYIEFIGFNTEQTFDTVQIIENGTVMIQYSGSSVPPSYTSSTDSVSIRFSSDGEIQGRGFEGTIQEISSLAVATNISTSSINESLPCRFAGIITDIPQTITSPGWPGKYGDSIRCRWIIRAATPDHRLKVEFEHFHTEDNYDFLRGLENGTEVFRYSGSILPPSYISKTNSIVLEFTSDSTFNEDGFLASIREINPTISPTTTALTTGAALSRIGNDTESYTTIQPTMPIEIDQDIVNIRDIEFLPSCSTQGFINSIFRCQFIFAEPNQYKGSITCKNELKKAAACIGREISLCRVGGMRNVLDNLNFPFFNSKNLVSYFRNLSRDIGDELNNEVNAFCFHAGLNLPYPYPVSTRLDGCESGILQNLVTQFQTFYYGYTWARNRDDVCRSPQNPNSSTAHKSNNFLIKVGAWSSDEYLSGYLLLSEGPELVECICLDINKSFRRLKQWFLDAAANRCDFSTLTQFGYNAPSVQYLTDVARVVLHTITRLNASACLDESDELELETLFGCPTHS